MKLSPSFAPVLFCLLWLAEVFWRNTCSWAGLANCNKTMKNNSSNRARGITKESWWLLPYLTAWNASHNLFFFGIFLYSCKNAQCYHIQMSFFFPERYSNRLSSLKILKCSQTYLLKSVWEQFLINPATLKAWHDYCTGVPSAAYKIRWLYQVQFYHITCAIRMPVNLIVIYLPSEGRSSVSSSFSLWSNAVPHQNWLEGEMLTFWGVCFEQLSSQINPNFGQVKVVDSIVRVSSLLMSTLWIEWPMVGVGLWYGPRTQVHFIDAVLNAVIPWKEILRPIVVPFIHDHHLRVQHDDAWPHVARICIQLLEAENIPILVWPADSPEMSPIVQLKFCGSSGVMWPTG